MCSESAAEAGLLLCVDALLLTRRPLVGLRPLLELVPCPHIIGTFPS